MPRPFTRLGLPILLAVLALAAYAGWRGHAARQAWKASLPPLPALVGASAPGLDARLAACAARLQAWPPDHAALVEFTRVCHANGQLDEAMAGYRALLTLQPAEPRWPHLLASILSGYGRLDEALPLMRRTTELAPGHLVAWLKLGDALLKSNALPDAEAVYQQALQRDAANPYALLGLARCDLQAGRLTAARSHLQQAVAGRSDLAGAQSLLATVFDRLGNPAAAAAARARIENSGHFTEPADPWLEDLAQDCHDPYTLLTLASTAMADGSPRKAVPLLERGLALAPDEPRLRRQFAKTLAALDDLPRARAELERAVALVPDNDAFRLDLIALLRRAHDEPAADRAILDGLAACPRSTGLHFEAGRLAAQAGRLDEAAGHFEFTWRTRPDQSTAALALAEVYFRTRRAADAIALLEEVLVHYPAEARALELLVRHGIETGDARTAGWLRRLIAADAPGQLVAELREHYRRRFGAALP